MHGMNLAKVDFKSKCTQSSHCLQYEIANAAKHADPLAVWIEVDVKNCDADQILRVP